MQGKKRYFVIVLFLLLGLTTFTFASPREFSKSQKPKNGTSERVSNDTQARKSYAEAVEAVEDAEEDPTLETVENARLEIQNADDATDDQITQLQNRVNVVENTIDVAALVSELEELVKVKETFDTASLKYPTADTEVNKLEEGNVKENLVTRLERVEKILNDSSKPVYTGVTNNQITNENVKLVVTDDTNVTKTVTLNNEVVDFKEEFQEEGVYVVTLVDEAFNEETVTFTIDKTAPSFVDLKSGNHYETIKVLVDDETATIIVLNNDTKVTTDVTNGTVLTEDATYKLTVKDAAGNSKSIWVAVDTTNPTITGVTNGSIVNKSEKIYVKDKFLTNVQITGPNSKGEVVTKEFTRSDFEVGSNNENFSFEYKANYEGKWTVVATDKAGNTYSETFTIDRTAAKKNAVNANVNGYKNEVKEQYATNGNTVTAYISISEELKYNPTFTFYANGKEIKVINKEDVTSRLSSNEKYPYVYEVKLAISENLVAEDGALTFTVTDIVDKAGNATADITKVSNGKVVKLDRTAPVRKSADFYVSGLTQVGKIFYTQYGKKVVVNITTDEELKEVPTFTLHNNGNDYVMEDAIYRGLNDKGYHLYQASLVITKELGMVDGEITFTVSNIADKAGNSRDNITEPTNGRKVVLDNVLNVEKLALVGGIGLWSKDKSVYNQYATTGTTIYVNARFYEELAATPVVTLNDKVTLTKATKQQSGNIWIYSYSYKIKENDGLEDGLVQVKVTNIKDFAGNATELTNANASMKSQKNILIDRTAPTYRFTKYGSSLVKDEIKPIEKDGVLYFEEPVRVSLSDAINLRLHGVDTYSDDKNTLRTGWLKDVNQSGEHTAVAVDSVGNRTEFKFVVGAVPPVKEDDTINLTEDITLVNSSFYNDIKTENPVTINGNGKTVTQYITSSDKLTWKANNLYGKTDPTSRNIPVLGNVFSSLKGAKVTVNDITFAGTHHSIMLGNYEDSSSNWFNTEFNNVNIIDTNVVSLSSNIAPAAVIYGNATLNNVNIYGTKRSELEAIDDNRWPFWPVYDLAAVNSSNTTINGGKIGTMYLWAKAVMTINNAEVDTIDTLITTGHLEIGTGTTVNRINMNGTNAYKPDVTVKAGATVKVLDLSKVTNFTDIIIEEGANVETVITQDGEMSYEDWMASKTPLGQLKLIAKNGGTFKLTESLILDEILEIAQDKTVIIDLNNHELKLVNEDDSTSRLIQNSGKLTIKNGSIVNDKAHAYGLIENNAAGEVVLENINITDKGNANSSAILNKGKIKFVNSKYNGTSTAPGNAFINSSGDLEINNSEITSVSTKAYSTIVSGGKAVIDDSKISVTRGGVGVTGGEVTINNTNIATKTGTNSYYAVYVSESTNTTVTINNGTFTGYKAGLYAGHNDRGNLNVTINGGTFTGTRGNASAAIFTKSTETPTHTVEFVIKGGTYKGNKHDVSAYVAEGYEQNSAGEVVKKD